MHAHTTASVATGIPVVIPAPTTPGAAISVLDKRDASSSPLDNDGARSHSVRRARTSRSRRSVNSNDEELDGVELWSSEMGPTVSQLFPPLIVSGLPAGRQQQHQLDNAVARSAASTQPRDEDGGADTGSAASTQF